MVSKSRKTKKFVRQAVSKAKYYVLRHQLTALLVVMLLILVSWGAYNYFVYGWGTSTWATHIGPGGKLWWDWLQLLIVPVVLALGALLFNRQEKRSELQIAENRAQDAVLLNYIDKMGELILEKQLMGVLRVRKGALKEKPELGEKELDHLLSDEQRAVRDMAQTRTVTVLRQLNVDRRKIVLQFLRDAGLETFVLVKATLEDADLRDASLYSFNLSFAQLKRANLERVNLIGSRLEEANLSEANLVGANLRGANLHKTYLIDTNLRGAVLNLAIMCEAVLVRADLTKAIMISTKLELANLRGAKLLNAELTNAVLKKADLSETDFRGANLYQVNLCQSTLHLAKVGNKQLATAKSLDNATLSDGKKFDPMVHTFWKKQPLDEGEQYEEN